MNLNRRDTDQHKQRVKKLEEIYEDHVQVWIPIVWLHVRIYDYMSGNMIKNEEIWKSCPGLHPFSSWFVINCHYPNHPIPSCRASSSSLFRFKYSWSWSAKLSSLSLSLKSSLVSSLQKIKRAIERKLKQAKELGRDMDSDSRSSSSSSLSSS